MLTALEPLAVNNFGDTREGALMGPMGLFIIVLMVIATVLLIRNMNARLRRLPDRFPDQDADKAADKAAGKDAAPAAEAPDDLRELDEASGPATVEPSADERARDSGS